MRICPLPKAYLSPGGLGPWDSLLPGPTESPNRSGSSSSAGPLPGCSSPDWASLQPPHRSPCQEPGCPSPRAALLGPWSLLAGSLTPDCLPCQGRAVQGRWGLLLLPPQPSLPPRLLSPPLSAGLSLLALGPCTYFNSSTTERVWHWAS